MDTSLCVCLPLLSAVFDQCHHSQKNSWTRCVSVLINHRLVAVSLKATKNTFGYSLRSAKAHLSLNNTTSPSLNCGIHSMNYFCFFYLQYVLYEQKVSKIEMFNFFFFLKPHLSPCIFCVQCIGTSSVAQRRKKQIERT